MKRILSRLTLVFSSRAFFVAVLLFFIVQASWIALSALYPMAFDEDFHFGIIKIYSTHLSPFLTEHPANADAFGAVTRDPSYLYHYLMSFPYRLLTHIFEGETARIIVLRILNVAMFAYALVLFRHLLFRLTQSRAFTHVSLAIFTLIPIVPQLAAHINYDNLLMILVAWSCLLVTDIYRQFAAGRVDFRKVATLCIVCLLTSVVKYAFLPIFFAIIVFVLFAAFRSFHSWPSLRDALRLNWTHISKRTKLGLLAMILVAGGLFFQRFGINVIRYHQPIPSCELVLTIDHCSAYGPWNRDYRLAQTKSPDSTKNPVVYTGLWFRGLFWRLFFAINSPLRNYTNYPPLPFPAISALAIMGITLILLIIYARSVFSRQPLLLFAGLVVLIYSTSLWVEDYKMFIETGQPVAINGRYMIPVLLLLAAVGWRVWCVFLERVRATQLKAVLASAALLCFMQGGGVFTFIMRSDPSWYWPNQHVIDANATAQKILDPIIIQGSKQTNIAP